MDSQKDLPWQGKVINSAQVAGIETCVLDSGQGKGVQIAWINTGSGLRYQVVIDRALDIGQAFYNQHSLAWLSHAGIVAPRPDANKDLEWLYSFGGGLLATCGLTHVGGPEADDNEERGLHGRIGNMRSTVESIVQPNIFSGNLDMSITAVMEQSRMFGPNLELRRTITSRVGESKICINDVVTNRANTSCPHMMLYHCNFGWPLVNGGTDIIWKGHCESRGMEMDNAIFNDKHDFKKCPEPMDSHSAGGEACGFIDVSEDNNGNCRVGLRNKNLSLAVCIKYKKSQLPWLTNWQHWGYGEYITGIEPGTNPPIGQNSAREKGKLVFIEPGQSKTYELEISVLTKQQEIEEFVTLVN